MNRAEIETYLRLVGEELARQDLVGEIIITGGAFMLLVVQSREATQDVDAYFAAEPAAIREAARVVAQRHHLSPNWLNDAVKGFFYTSPPAQLWMEFAGLRVYTAGAEYVFAMKALAGRPQDRADLQALLGPLHLTDAEQALAIVRRYIPERFLTARTRLVVESLFDA